MEWLIRFLISKKRIFWSLRNIANGILLWGAQADDNRQLLNSRKRHWNNRNSKNYSKAKEGSSWSIYDIIYSVKTALLSTEKSNGHQHQMGISNLIMRICHMIILCWFALLFGRCFGFSPRTWALLSFFLRRRRYWGRVWQGNPALPQDKIN